MSARRFLAMLLVIAAVCALPAAADPGPHRLTVVLSADEPAYLETWQAFRDTLNDLAGPALRFDIELITLHDDKSISIRDPAAGSPELVVPVGAQAAKYALEHYPETPAFNILITRDAFEAIRAGDDSGKASALFLEQPLDRQFRLLRLTLPAVRNVSVVLGDHSRAAAAGLLAAAARSDIVLHVIDLGAARTPVDAFSAALERGDAVLAFPDPEVLSPNHAKWLLYMAYQQRKPVLGFSRALSDAGALAALFTTPEQIGRQAAQQVHDLALSARQRPDRPWRLPPPAWPRYFSVSLNRAVARALEIDTRDQRQLAQGLWSIEQSDRMQAGQERPDPGRARP